MPTDALDVPELETPQQWDCAPLGNLVEEERGISYGIVQPGKHDDSGIPIVRVNNLRGGRILTDDVLRVAPDIESDYARTRLRGGEVLLSLVGTLGECAVVPKELAGWNVARAVAVIPPKTNIDPHWLAMCLRSTNIQALMRAWATTTVQATLNLRDVRRLPILLLPEPDRSNITVAIKQLDDKIEENRRTARALEGLAQATFKAWFVDFEPVRAKAAGQTSFPGLPSAAFSALPDRLTDSELGPVPEGWVVRRIGDLVSVKGGATPSTKVAEYWDGGTHFWATPKDLSGLQDPVLLETERLITDAGAECISSGVMPKDTVLLSSRAPVGYTVLAKVPVAVNQGFIAMICDGPLPPHYVLHWTRSVLDEIKSRASGTTFPEISKAAFRPIPAILPTPEVLKEFEHFAKSLFDLIEANVRQSRQLSQLRDYLLPRLLSGSVRVRV